MPKGSTTTGDDERRRQIKEMLYERVCGTRGLEGFLSSIVMSTDYAEQVARGLRQSSDGAHDLVWLFEECSAEAQPGWKSKSHRAAFVARCRDIRQTVQDIVDGPVSALDVLVSQLGFDRRQVGRMTASAQHDTERVLADLLRLQNNRREQWDRRAEALSLGSERAQDGNVFEVESIIDRRQVGHSLQYLLRWKGFSRDWDCWEPVDNIFSGDLLKQFEQGRLRRSRPAAEDEPPRQKRPADRPAQQDDKRPRTSRPQQDDERPPTATRRQLADDQLLPEQPPHRLFAVLPGHRHVIGWTDPPRLFVVDASTTASCYPHLLHDYLDSCVQFNEEL